MDKEARDRALAKVRKLLAMSNDGRGNATEAETAARQAAALMEKFNIDSAEAQLEDLNSDSPDLAQDYVASSYDPGAKNKQKTLPKWLGILAVGVGHLCQVKVDAVTHDGAMTVRFSGYATDVVFARWVLEVLSRGIFNQARAELGHLSRAEREDFRYAAAFALQCRMKDLRQEQVKASSGTALVVVDKKQQVIAATYGEMRFSRSSRDFASSASREAGKAYGQRAAIPTARPLGQGTTTQKRLGA